ncbi:hypothetical protein F4810DRAFT_205817 [Camillea tinctor]|nr:hypothetical protein F4810DRAFT_205817 [Camillea tinctor]
MSSHLLLCHALVATPKVAPQQSKSRSKVAQSLQRACERNHQPRNCDPIGWNVCTKENTKSVHHHYYYYHHYYHYQNQTPNPPSLMLREREKQRTKEKEAIYHHNASTTIEERRREKEKKKKKKKRIRRRIRVLWKLLHIRQLVQQLYSTARRSPTNLCATPSTSFNFTKLLFSSSFFLFFFLFALHPLSSANTITYVTSPKELLNSLLFFLYNESFQ